MRHFVEYFIKIEICDIIFVVICRFANLFEERQHVSDNRFAFAEPMLEIFYHLMSIEVFTKVEPR